MIYAWARAGINLPHSSRQQYNAGQQIPVGQAKVGDLIFLAHNTSNPGTIHHVAMIYSPGQIIEAQQTGVPVHIRSFRGAAEPEIMPYAVRLAA
jgi:cell wall-associated NlpC family hydrolase